MEAIFDVGAHDGETGLRLATSHPWLPVYSFEPTPDLAEAIFNNKRKHEAKLGRTLDNFRLVPKAVSNFNGTATFNVAVNTGCSSFLNFQENLKQTWPGRTGLEFMKTIEVDVIRLDDFCAAEGIDLIGYLHCDTQGSDLDVLEGLGRFRERVVQGVIEVAVSQYVALYKNQYVLEDAVVKLREWNYEITHVFPEGFPSPQELNLVYRNKRFSNNIPDVRREL